MGMANALSNPITDITINNSSKVNPSAGVERTSLTWDEPQRWFWWFVKAITPIRVACQPVEQIDLAAAVWRVATLLANPLGCLDDQAVRWL